MQNILAKFLCQHWKGFLAFSIQIAIIVGGINYYKDNRNTSKLETTIINIDKKIDGMDKKITLLAVNDSIMNQQLQFYPAAVPTNGNVTSRYQVRTDPVNGEQRMHTGVDIKADKGTPVLSTATGMIESCDTDAGDYGKRIIINHMNGYKSIYGHLSKILVTEGKTVVRGDTIGLVGNSGRSTGSHLHYEISFHDKKINPATFRKQYSEVLNTPSLLYSQL